MRVLTIGTFDLFHDGHIYLLEHCKRLATVSDDRRWPGSLIGIPRDEVVIGVNSDEFIKTFKSAPIVPLKSREASLKAYGTVVVHNGETQAFIERHRPDYLVIGSDWARKDYLKQIQTTQDWLDSQRIALVFVPRPSHSESSTKIRALRD